MDLEQEGLAVAREIEVAFADVTREGGTSWAEAIERRQAQGRWMEEHGILEADESDEEDEFEEDEPEPSYQDRDHRWQDLVDDPDWRITSQQGGFAYLDPIGSRYYLPAAMMRSVQNPAEEGIAFWLSRLDYVVETTPAEIDHESYFFGRWSALDERMIRCVGRFLRYRLALAESKFEEDRLRLNYALMSEDILAIVRHVALGYWEAAVKSWRLIEPQALRRTSTPGPSSRPR